MGRGKVPFEVFEKVMDQASFESDQEMWRDISQILSKTGNWKVKERSDVTFQVGRVRRD